jgi:hypothetical protein
MVYAGGGKGACWGSGASVSSTGLCMGCPCVETPRRRAPGQSVINTAYSEWLTQHTRARLASLTRRGRALARQPLSHGMYLIGTVDNFVTPHESVCVAGGKQTPAMAAWIPLMVGRARHCCRFMCHRPVGAHLSNVGLPRVRSNARWHSSVHSDHG